MPEENKSEEEGDVVANLVFQSMESYGKLKAINDIMGLISSIGMKEFPPEFIRKFSMMSVDCMRQHFENSRLIDMHEEVKR